MQQQHEQERKFKARKRENRMRILITVNFCEVESRIRSHCCSDEFSQSTVFGKQSHYVAGFCLSANNVILKHPSTRSAHSKVNTSAKPNNHLKFVVIYCYQRSLDGTTLSHVVHYVIQRCQLANVDENK